MYRKELTKTPEGSFEALFASAFDGWDGETGWMCFYDVKLHDSILYEIKDKGFNPNGEFDLTIDTEKMIAEIVKADGDEGVVILRYKLRVSIDHEIK